MVAVRSAQDSKTFDVTQDVLAEDALLRQVSVVLLLLWGERLVLGFLVRCLAVLVPLLQSLVARIGQHLGGGVEAQTRSFEEREVVCGAASKGSGQDAPRRVFDYDLGLEGVAFLLAGVETRLFFLTWGL